MGTIAKRFGIFLLAAGVIAGLTGCEKKTEGPTPVLETVSPKTVCSQQLDTWVRVTGSGFSPSPKDGLTDKSKLALPQLSVQRTRQLNGTAVTMGPVPINVDPTNTDNTRVRWRSQNEMSFIANQTPPLASGIYNLNMKNPTGAEGFLNDALVVVPPPQLSAVTPTEICSSQQAITLNLTGSGFLVLEGRTPNVTVASDDGSSVTASSVEMVDDACEAIFGLNNSYSCSEITVSLPARSVSNEGLYTVSLTNPATANCTSPTTVTFMVVPRPVISSVQPNEICSAQIDTTITLTGTGFLVREQEMPAVTVSVGTTTVVASSVAMVDGACEPFDATTDAYICTQITATVAAGDLVDEGIYSVSLTNPGSSGCTTETASPFTVVEAPIIFSLDPPAMYNGISVRETIYVAGLDAAPEGVNLVPTGGGTETALTNVVWDQTDPNEVTATVPAGIAAGTYDVIILNSGCNAVLAGQFTVVDTSTIALLDPAVAPPFAHKGRSRLPPRDRYDRSIHPRRNRFPIQSRSRRR